LQFDQPDRARAQLELARAAFERMGASGPCAQIDDELDEITSGTGQAGPAQLSS
jgi:hypothetical protein